MTRRSAVSYSRFSAPKQAKGDSEDRQEREYTAFCERHNLTPGKEVYVDRGRSGYHGEHRSKGRLGQLIEAAKDNRFDPGTVIVIEAWDRLGRLRPDRQTELVAELLRTGVAIGICRLNEIFAEEDFGTHKWTTLAVFIQLAFQESKQKAERLAAVWERRRDRAREKGELVGGNLPAWIEVIDGKMKLIEARAEVIRRVFQMSADGLGLTRIVSALESERVPAFGERVVREGRSRSQFAGRWTRPYLTRVLNDRRAVGEMVFLKGDNEHTKITDYFPAVVTEEQFALARAGQERRRIAPGESRERQGRHPNVFQGLLINPRDGEGYRMSNNGTRENPELFLRSASSMNGTAPKSYTIPYFVFEEAVLGRLTEIDPATVLPRDQTATTTADTLRVRLAAVRGELAAMQEELSRGFSKTLMGAVRTKEAEELDLANQLQDELARNVKPLARQWGDLPNLASAITTAADPGAARLKLRSALRVVVDTVALLIVPRGPWRFAAVRIQFVGGAHRDYLIAHQSANKKASRDARTHVADYKWDAGQGGELDLRKSDDAKVVEELLTTANLADLITAIEAM